MNKIIQIGDYIKMKESLNKEEWYNPNTLKVIDILNMESPFGKFDTVYVTNEDTYLYSKDIQGTDSQIEIVPIM